MASDNISIKIPKAFSVGIRQSESHWTSSRGSCEIKSQKGFLTPYDTNAAYRKRFETLTSWTHGSKAYEIHENVPNDPTTGFKMKECVSRWRTQNKFFVVEDPRGFDLEVSIPNLETIFPDVTIENGVIKEACVWARDGSNNVLLPITSPEYKVAQENTKRVSVKISMKDINPGDRVQLHDTTEVVYVGRHKAKYDVHTYARNMRTGRSYWMGDHYEDVYKSSEVKIDKARHWFLFKTAQGGMTYMTISSPKISKILSNDKDFVFPNPLDATVCQMQSFGKLKDTPSVIDFRHTYHDPFEEFGQGPRYNTGLVKVSEFIGFEGLEFPSK